jgi:16S rRNA (cytosine1402-N4)-methyltransferase
MANGGTHSHKPVLLKEVLEVLRPAKGSVVLDGTIGLGGHSREIVQRIAPGGTLIGLDKDEAALYEAKRNLRDFETSVRLFHAGFEDSEQVFEELGVEKVDGVLLDLGASSFQIDNPERGFSFLKDGPLDMRMDRSTGRTAEEVVNTYSEQKLFDIFAKYGEERYARGIARAIVQDRKRQPFTRTVELSDLIKRITRGKRFRIHPATRVFQALRIEVNAELDALEQFLEMLPGILGEGGRAAIISFHSLEDRLVKNHFRKGSQQGMYALVTKKPIVAGERERRENIRSRSAKLRGVERRASI